MSMYTRKPTTSLQSVTKPKHYNTNGDWAMVFSVVTSKKTEFVGNLLTATTVNTPQGRARPKPLLYQELVTSPAWNESLTL